MIEKHNSNKDATFRMEHNQFSAMDNDEKSQFNGARLPPHQEGTRYLDIEDLAGSTRQLPTSIDYRTDKCLSAVKNQGSCGSCWAFTAIAPLEFAQCKKTGTAVLLSEQQLVDCDPYDSGCGGGWYTNAWYYLKNGSAKQSSYTYTATKSTCKYTASMLAATVSTYGTIAANNTVAMQTALQKYGPLAVAIAVTNTFYNYAGGVYTDRTCDSMNINHGVVVVGYGTTLSSMNYWIGRNSWSSRWGVGGYFLIQRGVNKCKIEDYAAYVA